MKAVNKQNIFYVESKNVLAFPTSTRRKSPEGSDIALPDGRRFSEFNITQILDSLIDYNTIDGPGFVCDYTLNSLKTHITSCTLMIKGYVFKIVNENIDLSKDWYASIIVHTQDNSKASTLSTLSEDTLRFKDFEDDSKQQLCEGLILSNEKPTKIDELVSDYTETEEGFDNIALAKYYTIPLVVDSVIQRHKFSSDSIMNIDGGTC